MKFGDGKFTIKEAALKNAQHFMTDRPLMKAIHAAVKKEATFDDILSYTPSKLLRKGLKVEELKKIVKLLSMYGWCLQNYTHAGVTCNLIRERVVDKKPKVEHGREPTDAEVDKAFEDADAFQKKVDKETETQPSV